MKTLFVNKIYPPSHGATGRALKELRENLQNLGEDVDVLHTPEHKNRFTSLLKLLLKSFFISNKKYDCVVLMTDPPFILLLAPILKLKGVKVIHWSHDVYPDLFSVFDFNFLGTGFFQKLNKCLLKCVDEIVVIGRDMESLMKEKYNVSEEKITVIYNWADRFIKPMKVKTDKFIVMYSGNWGKAYNFDTILNVAERLKSEKNIEFQLIGEGAQKDHIVKCIKNRKITNIIVSNFKPISHYVESINSADAHFVAVKKETKGLMVPCKTYACLAAGRPCIYLGDNKSEIALMLKEYDCGFVSDNPDELAKTILSLYKNPELMKEKKKNALKINDYFGVHKAAERFKEVIHKCTANN